MSNISQKTGPADQAKTKAQLLVELSELRQRVAHLEAAERPPAETGLPNRENWFRLIFETSHQGIWQVSPQGNILSANPSIARMLGYPVAELVGCSLFDFVDESDLAQYRAIFKNRQRGQAEQVEIRLRRKDGSDLWVLLSATPVMSDQGELLFSVGMFTDITERKQAEVALQESEARYRLLFQNNLDAVFLTTPDGRTLEANPAAGEMFGYTVAEICQLGRAGLVDTTDPRLSLALEERARTGKFVGELTYLRRDGTPFPGEVSSTVFLDPNGELKTSLIVRDITERKQAEAALRANEQKFRQVIEHSGDGILMADETGRIVEWNPAIEQITGLTRAKAVGRTGWDVQFDLLSAERRTPAVHDWIEANLRTYFKTGQSPQLGRPAEFEIQRPDGSYRDIQMVDFSIKTGTGFGWGSIVRDITERKQVERIEAAQLAVNRILAESIEPAVALRQILAAIAGRLGWQLAKLWWPSSDGSRLVWRDGWRVPDQPELAEFEQVSQGYTFEPGEGLTGTVWQTGQATWDQDLRLPKLAAAALAVGLHSATGIPIIKDGVTVGVMTFFSCSARPLEEWLLAVLTDLGRQIGQFLARKEAEASLRRYEQMVSTTPDWMSLVDRNYVYQIVNQTYLTLNNKLHAQIIGHPVADLTGELVFETLIQPYLDQALAGEIVQYQEWFDFPGIGRRFNDVTYAPYREKDGTISGVLVSGRDITEAKLLEERLHQAQKMETVGQLAAGMAHHYNSMLTGIIGFTSLSLHTLPSGDPLTKNLERVLQTAERMAVLVRQLLAFAQKQLLQLKTGNLNELVMKLEDELKQSASAPIEFALDLAPEVGQVKIDPRQFEYLLRALVSNALDAMPEGGQLTLTTATVNLGPLEAGWYDLTPGDYVLLTVKDTGIGLTDEVKAHLFEPFFTTKEVGRGTGLGLAMSLGIAKQHGGHLVAESEPGQGATFMLYLPCLAPPEPSTSPGRSTPAQTILLIEAEPMVREFVAEILSDQGYNVLKATTNEVALELTTGQPGVSLQLLLTPAHPNNPALIEQLKANSPGLKVIFLIDELEELPPERVDFLLKPFTPSSLVQKVRAVLEITSE